MKVAVMNMSGNVGKTTIARQLLAPRLGAPVIPIESINADDQEVEALLRGSQYGELLAQIGGLSRAVIDVGASNVEDLLEGMRLYRGSADEEFDVVIVPTIGSPKQIRDTIATIDALRDRGVRGDKIRLLFNMVDYRDTVPAVFATIFSYWADHKDFRLDPTAVIHTNELFEQLAGANVADLVADQTDFKALRAQTADPGEKRAITHRLGLRRLARGVSEEFNAVYKILMN